MTAETQGSETSATPTIAAWHKDQTVVHRITHRVGVVQAVDFEESLVTVAWRGDTASQDWTGVARMENLWEALTGGAM